MNARVLAPCLLLAAGCGGATEPPAASPSAPPGTMAMASPSPMGPTLEVEVVTVDPAGPSITLREGEVAPTRSPRAGDLKAGDRTIRVEPSAAAALATVKPGDRVRVTCMALPSAVDAAPMPGMASPGMMSPGMMSPGMMGSPGTMPATGMPPVTGGATPGLARCDSVVSITPMGATGF